jgi:hypothetical protein
MPTTESRSESGRRYRSLEAFRRQFFPDDAKGDPLTLASSQSLGVQMAREALDRLLGPERQDVASRR